MMIFLYTGWEVKDFDLDLLKLIKYWSYFVLTYILKNC